MGVFSHKSQCAQITFPDPRTETTSQHCRQAKRNCRFFCSHLGSSSCRLLFSCVVAFCILARRRAMPRKGWSTVEVPDGWLQIIRGPRPPGSCAKASVSSLDVTTVEYTFIQSFTPNDTFFQCLKIFIQSRIHLCENGAREGEKSATFCGPHLSAPHPSAPDPAGPYLSPPFGPPHIRPTETKINQTTKNTNLGKSRNWPKSN